MSPRVTPEYKERRRNEILDVARRVFEDRGYNATSMQHISDCLPLSRGAIYQYFANKEEVFQALLERSYEKLVVKLRRLLLVSSSVREALDTYISDGDVQENQADGDEQKFNRFNAAVFEYNVSVGEDNEEKTTFRYQRYKRVLDAFVEFLQAGVDSGEFQPRFALNAIADTFLVLQDGVAFTEIGFKPDFVSVSEQETLMIAFLQFALGLN